MSLGPQGEEEERGKLGKLQRGNPMHCSRREVRGKHLGSMACPVWHAVPGHLEDGHPVLYSYKIKQNTVSEKSGYEI